MTVLSLNVLIPLEYGAATLHQQNVLSLPATTCRLQRSELNTILLANMRLPLAQWPNVSPILRKVWTRSSVRMHGIMAMVVQDLLFIAISITTPVSLELLMLGQLHWNTWLAHPGAGMARWAMLEAQTTVLSLNVLTLLDSALATSLQLTVFPLLDPTCTPQRTAWHNGKPTPLQVPLFVWMHGTPIWRQLRERCLVQLCEILAMVVQDFLFIAISLPTPVMTTAPLTTVVSVDCRPRNSECTRATPAMVVQDFLFIAVVQAAPPNWDIYQWQLSVPLREVLAMVVQRMLFIAASPGMLMIAPQFGMVRPNAATLTVHDYRIHGYYELAPVPDNCCTLATMTCTSTDHLLHQYRKPRPP
jgi:hypothetical protein